jgi:tripartite-type tricarboxylate transporter receptor subunit TctC
MLTKRVFLSTIATAGAAAGFGLAVRSQAFADGYPSRAIHFILPFPAGPVDLVGRLYAQRISQDWHEPAVVDSRPGATGSIGTEVVVKAKPDGYTLLFTADLPITMAPNLLKVPYDPQRDLIPIAAVMETHNVLVTNTGTGIKTLAELIAAAKAKPGVLTFSSGGIGSPAHLCSEMIDHQAGITMTHVPYKTAAEAMNAVLAGTVTAFCGVISQALPFLKSGQVYALGISGSKPSPLLPQVAPLSATYPGLVTTNWHGVFAPPHTPKAVCDKLAAEMKKIYDDPEVKQKLLSVGLEPNWIPGTELTQRIAADLKKWHDFMTVAGIHAG